MTCPLKHVRTMKITQFPSDPSISQENKKENSEKGI